MRARLGEHDGSEPLALASEPSFGDDQSGGESGCGQAAHLLHSEPWCSSDKEKCNLKYKYQRSIEEKKA